MKKITFKGLDKKHHDFMGVPKPSQSLIPKWFKDIPMYATGKEKEPNFITNGQLYDVFYRPDIVQAKFRGDDISKLISISATENDQEVTVCVEDTGVGMNSEILTNLFNSGIQQNKAGTNNESGSGLGLLLCKELVEENSGKIWAESNIDSGTKFLFTLRKQ